MKNLFFAIGIVLFGFSACKQPPAPVADASGHLYFGEKIDDQGFSSFEDFNVDFPNTDTVKVKLEGMVEGVCQAKGCWMNVVDTKDESKAIFVKFKDYGFFMPKDLSGQRVIMEGKAYKETTSVDELRHYAEDEGKSKEEIMKITEPVEELKFLAHGVMIKK